jgi:hypothetical protein
MDQDDSFLAARHSFLGVPALDLYLESMHKGPVTVSFVIEVALVSCALVLNAILIGFRRIFIDGLPGRKGTFRLQSDVMLGVLRALEIIAKDPNLSEETGWNIRHLLHGRQAKPQPGELPTEAAQVDPGYLGPRHESKGS